MSGSLTFSGSAGSSYSAPSGYSYVTGSFSIAPTGDAVIAPTSGSFIQFIDTAPITGDGYIEATLDWNSATATNEAGFCCIDGSGNGWSLIMQGTAIRIRQEGGAYADLATTTRTISGVTTIRIDFTAAGALSVKQDSVEFLTHNFGSSLIGLNVGLQHYRDASEGQRYRTMVTVTGGAPSATIDTLDNPLTVGGTHNITTTGLGTLTTATTVGGKAIASASATGGDGTITLAGFVAGQTYPAMGTQSVVASDGTDTASINRTLTTMSGYVYTAVSGLDRGEWSFGKAFDIDENPLELHVENINGLITLNPDGTANDMPATGTGTAWARMASGGGFVSGEMVSFTFIVTEAALEIPPTMPADTSANTPEGSTTVGTYAAVAGDSPITYTLGGTDAALFSINSSTAVVTWVSAPNYESGTIVRNITVTGTNAYGSDLMNLTVNVTNVVEPPVMPADAIYTVIQGATTVSNPSASFVDGVITYTKSGANHALFTINSSTGRLTPVSALNTLGDFVVIVTATNSAGADSQTVTFRVVAASEETTGATSRNITSRSIVSRGVTSR